MLRVSGMTVLAVLLIMCLESASVIACVEKGDEPLLE